METLRQNAGLICASHRRRLAGREHLITANSRRDLSVAKKYMGDVVFPSLT